MRFIQNSADVKKHNINKLSHKFDLAPDIIKMLISRGFDDADKIEKFLYPSISQFHNPYLLKDMDNVVKRLKIAIDKKEKVVILGDYDTDGISASAILYKFFLSKGLKTNVFLPNRFVDGYGLNNGTIDKIINLYNPSLIITVDCGITCKAEVDYCKSKGVDIIITDHHEIPDELPNTLTINAKIEDQEYPFKELCGAGVALKIVQAMVGQTQALKYTTIAAIATVADIVPLVDENRFIVYNGLKYQDENLPIGLKKLCKKTKIDLPLNSQDISYKLAPKINASGRMGDASISYNLYVAEKDSEISSNITKLLSLNDDRLENTNIITDDAFAMLDKINVTNLGIIVLCKDGWESGVLGIICAKIVEKYHKPVCLLTNVEGEYKGSCRSIPGINIYEALSSVSDLLIRFGGHNQAGGLSLYKENIEEFTTRINEFILNKYSKEQFIPVKYYDIDANATNINYDFLTQIERLEPFGFGNEMPVYKFSFNNCSVSRLPKHPNHLKIKVDDMDIICFGIGDMYYNFTANINKDMLLGINIERYGNMAHPGGKLKFIRFNKLNGSIRKDVIVANYLHQLSFIGTKAESSNIVHTDYDTMISKLNDLCTESNAGTLVICNTNKSYENVSKLSIVNNFELYKINHSMGENTVLFAPISEANFINYSNIVLLDQPLESGYVNMLANYGANVYVVDSDNNSKLFSSLDTSRNVFGIYTNIIKDFCNKKISSPDLPNTFKIIRKLNPQNSYLNYSQFYFVLLVLRQLGIISISEGNIEYNKSVVSKLYNSSIYNYVCNLKK